jgi:nucleotide-binding universal stress UspA family protein
MAEEQMPPKLVVVGLDGSSNAEKALVWTIALARVLDAEVIPVYALERPFVAYYPLAVAPPVELLQGWQDEVRGVFEDEWCRPLKESGLPYRPVMEEGRPAAVIAQVAEREGAGLVVVGRRGRGMVARLMLGSVSHELTTNCTVPVTVVADTTADAA